MSSWFNRSKQLPFILQLYNVLAGLSYVFPSLDAASYNNWPKLGVALSFITSLICLLAIPLGSRQDWSMHKTRLTLCMVLFSSCICQYEEHVFDSLQREGSFIPFANNMIDAWLPGFHCGNIQVHLAVHPCMRIALSYAARRSLFWVAGLCV